MKNKTIFFRNIYIVLMLRLLLVFVVYTVCRLLFYLLNRNIFTDIDFPYLLTMMIGGLKFDASAIFYTNILFIVLHIIPFRFRYNRAYQKAIAIIFYIVNGFAIALNMMDAVYYRYTFRRTTTAVFQEFANDNAFGFLRFIWEYGYITLMVILLIVALVWLYRKIKLEKPSVTQKWYLYYPVGALLMAIILYMSVVAMRGGYKGSTRPITLSNAAEYIRKPEHRAIVLNTPFALIRTIGKKKLEKKNYFSEEEAKAIFSVEKHSGADSCRFFHKLAGRNVVVIIWESFDREWVGGLNKNIPGYKGFTPFIDSLIPKSYVFERAYANGHRSIEALPSVLASIPSAETPFILSHYSGNTINSLGALLKKNGYNTSFFHGAPNGSMGFNAFVKQAGIDAYYGMAEYGNDKDFDGNWGIWDEPFLQFMASKINEFPEPFFTSVFTLSSHNPFVVPKEYENVFPKGEMPIHPCVGYSDNALRKFFEKISKEAWFNRTLFIITADHGVEGSIERYNTAEGAFAIPMIFYAPGEPDFTAFDDSTVVQQTDVMPTVLSLIGAKDRFISFGNNMFDTHALHFAVNYYNGAYQLIKGDWLLQFSNEKVVGLYNLKNDEYMKDNVKGKHSEVQNEMERLLKSFIQQYNERLIDNRLFDN